MIGSELDAAGVRDPALRESYRQCRKLNAEHGRTFFLATRLLAPSQRPAVHALYGFARRADDILDDVNAGVGTVERADALHLLATQLFERLVQGKNSGPAQRRHDPTLAAVVDTAQRYGIGWDLFDDFLGSMQMDLTVTDYPNRAALDRYMYGSAEVIGLQMLPILGHSVPYEQAAPHAAALGKAFQLTNFLRDIDEDLQRGRVYLPADELAVHQVDRELLTWCHDNGRTDARVRRALVEQHAATRELYREAQQGISVLDPRSRPCVEAAFTLYAEILDRIEAIDFAVFGQRATVGNGRRLRVGAAGIVKAWRARVKNTGGVTVDRWQYLFVLGACLAITAPLEIIGAGIYRQAWRAIGAVLPVAAVFIVWDALAIAADIWTYNPRYLTGIELPGAIPLEELLFFLVIPLCGLLTYSAVEGILALLARVRGGSSVRPS